MNNRRSRTLALPKQHRFAKAVAAAQQRDQLVLCGVDRDFALFDEVHFVCFRTGFENDHFRWHFHISEVLPVGINEIIFELNGGFLISLVVSENPLQAVTNNGASEYVCLICKIANLRPVVNPQLSRYPHSAVIFRHYGGNRFGYAIGIATGEHMPLGTPGFRVWRRDH